MAVITNPIKKLVIDQLINDVDSSGTQYFIGIGRSQQWNDSDVAPSEINHLREERDFRLSLQSIKTASDKSFVVPRYNWSSGTIYSAYSDAVQGYPIQPYYVMNDNNQVYMVIQQSKDATGVAQTSTVQPTGNTSGTPFATADGYIWKFLYSISSIDASKFISANFIPVKLQGATDSDSQAADVEQESVQNAAIVGQVLGYEIDSGGAGYTSAPTLTVGGNGSDAKAVATISGSNVVKVEVVDSSGTLAFGSGYDYANVVVSGGGSPSKPAKIRPILSTAGGLGADPRDDLRSNSLMFNVKPDGNETDKFITGNDFRQIGLIKDPLIHDSSGIFSEAAGIGLFKMTLSAVTTAFSNDNTILGASSQVQALIDKVDSSQIFFHQTEDTGFGSFDSGEAISEVDGNGAGTLSSNYLTPPDFNVHSGKILYIDNRAAVIRADDQTEDIKIVIQI